MHTKLGSTKKPQEQARLKFSTKQILKKNYYFSLRIQKEKKFDQVQTSMIYRSHTQKIVRQDYNLILIRWSWLFWDQ